jgi:hypothetical protein
LTNYRAGRSVATVQLLEMELKRFCLICKHYFAVQHKCLKFRQMASI